MWKRVGGLTLLSELVALVILTTATAVLFPVLMRIRVDRRLATCQSNMRKLGLAMHAYAADWQDRLPVWNQTTKRDGQDYAMTWDRAIGPYLKGTDATVVTCPGDVKGRKWREDKRQWAIIRSYACTAQLCGGWAPYTPETKRLRDIPALGRTVLLAETAHGDNPDDWAGSAVIDRLGEGEGGGESLDWFRHRVTTQIAFADCHVKAFSANEAGLSVALPGYAVNKVGASLCNYGDPLPGDD